MASPLQIIEVDRESVDHSPLEDAQGLTVGVLSCAIGLTFLTHLGFLTGQTAGLALLIAYVTGLSFGLVFLLVNIPFYALAWRRLGPEFTLKSLGCVVALSALTEFTPGLMGLGDLNPAFGVIAFGIATGLGLLGVFRHKGSLGGLGVIALLVQDTTGFRAGYVQLIADAMIFGVAALLFPLPMVLYSLGGAVVLNGVIAFNHRRDRYIAD